MLTHPKTLQTQELTERSKLPKQAMFNALQSCPDLVSQQAETTLEEAGGANTRSVTSLGVFIAPRPETVNLELQTLSSVETDGPFKKAVDDNDEY